MGKIFYTIFIGLIGYTYAGITNVYMEYNPTGVGTSNRPGPNKGTVTIYLQTDGDVNNPGMSSFRLEPGNSSPKHHDYPSLDCLVGTLQNMPGWHVPSTGATDAVVMDVSLTGDDHSSSPGTPYGSAKFIGGSDVAYGTTQCLFKLVEVDLKDCNWSGVSPAPPSGGFAIDNNLQGGFRLQIADTATGLGIATIGTIPAGQTLYAAGNKHTQYYEVDANGGINTDQEDWYNTNVMLGGAPFVPVTWPCAEKASDGASKYCVGSLPAAFDGSTCGKLDGDANQDITNVCYTGTHFCCAEDKQDGKGGVGSYCDSTYAMQAGSAPTPPPATPPPATPPPATPPPTTPPPTTPPPTPAPGSCDDYYADGGKCKRSSVSGQLIGDNCRPGQLKGCTGAGLTEVCACKECTEVDTPHEKGDPCKDDDDCGLTNGKCRAKNDACAAPLGATCNHDTDCVSGTCTGNVCA